MEGQHSVAGKAARDAFFAHKKKHPEPVPEKDQSPLFKRMQSEGAPRPVEKKP